MRRYGDFQLLPFLLLIATVGGLASLPLHAADEPSLPPPTENLAPTSPARSEPLSETPNPSVSPTPSDETATTTAPESPAVESQTPPPQLNSRIPRYHFVRPQWAIELNGSLNALGGTPLTPTQGNSTAFAVSLLAEYQPAFIQSLGVLGIGPALSVYPMGGHITPNTFAIYSIGGQIRYQARYFRQQPLVPMVAYSVEWLSYNFSNGPSGTVMTSGPVLGLWLLLNILEPSAAASAYITTGIARTYAVVEWKTFSGINSPVTLSGGSLYFGLRFEF